MPRQHINSVTTKVRDLLQLIREVGSDFDQDRCARVAAALSFTTLIALVPLLTVTLSMLSLFPVFETWTLKLEEILFRQFVPTAGEAVRDYLLEFSDKAGQLTAVGLVFLFVSSLLLLATIEDSFNDIWRVRRGRRFFQRLLVYWALLTLGPVMIVASLSISSAFMSVADVPDHPLLVGATAGLLRYLPFILETGAFVLFYKTIPNTDVRMVHALAGGVVAALLFELAKQAFAYYILNFPSYQVIYGALATIPIFFVWVYLSWLVLLVGAVIAAVLGRRQSRGDGAGIDLPEAQQVS